MKIIRRLLIIIIVLAVIVVGLSLYAINRIKIEIKESDLPQDVYESSEVSELMIITKATQIIFADEEDSYSLTENFLNLLIYDMIQNNINPDYDPINGETEESQYIVNNPQFQLDYIFAHLNDDSQIIITVSIKRNTFPEAMTAFHFIFDMEFTGYQLELTLNQVFLHDIEVKKNIYDYFVSMANKDEIEAYIDKGTLDLVNYTYTINFWDLVY